MMNKPESQPPTMPPDVVRYLKGAPPESRQFDFLIGEWDVAATRFKEDGSVLMQYKASWSAAYLNEGRMVMDDFRARLPTGQEISSYVTLRTYSELTQRWETAGLPALQPAANAEWHGIWKEGEMLLDVIGKGLDGKTLRNKIRFFNIDQHSFNWESTVSHDDGKNWHKAVSMSATRASR